jgi:excisionase family DNA binding protein
MNLDKNLLTVIAASKICGVTRATVWRWIKSGQLKAASTAGGHHRISEADLQIFMDKNKMNTSFRGHHKKRILIVDDDRAVRMFFKRLLEKDDIELEYASDGFEAGTKTIKFDPDLIILDLFMPKMDGFKVCKQIRSSQDTADIKIIAISGFDVKENIQKIIDSGADAFFPKPIDQNAIIQKIEMMLTI